jgi:hypothetical protein
MSRRACFGACPEYVIGLLKEAGISVMTFDVIPATTRFRRMKNGSMVYKRKRCPVHLTCLGTDIR